MNERYIGLMSGTSMDGIDGVLVDLSTLPGHVLATCHATYPPALRERLLVLAQAPQAPFSELLSLDVAVGRHFAEAAVQVLESAGLTAADVRAIGSHGQTIRHLPGQSPGSSLQIGDPNIIAERSGITTVADFRRRDMAAGGEGAPLVPAFHAAAFAGDACRAVLNIGGIANLTVLNPGGEVLGFDTGPGNLLMDAWAQRHGHGPMDRDGAWAAGGRVDQRLLTRLMDDPYFLRPPPKSTGREHFNLPWLEKRLQGLDPPPPARDVQATLCELTATSIHDALCRHAAQGRELPRELLVCGGGVHNDHLMARLKGLLPAQQIRSTVDVGLDPDLVEAVAFAWLARETLAGRAGNLPAVTGARRAVVLGGIYPGRTGI